MEALLVHSVAGVKGDVPDEVHGEAEGVVELEDLAAGDELLVIFFKACQQVVKNFHALLQCALEALLLHAQNLFGQFLLVYELGVNVSHLRGHCVHYFRKKRLSCPKQPCVARGPAYYAPEHVAPALVCRHEAVAQEEGGSARVVSYHS